MLQRPRSYFVNELAAEYPDPVPPRSLVLLELLTAVVMQQEGSERQPADVTASAERERRG